MKKLFTVALMIFGALSLNAFAQKSSIAEMISSNQRINKMFSGVLGDDNAGTENTEETSLSAIDFASAIKVTYLAETRKLEKARKKTVDKWLKSYGKTSGDKKFYVSETLVSENNVNYWIIAKESVLEQLKAKQKNDAVKMNLKILGYYRKGSTTEYLLLTDGLE
ncbi:MAG: hypothetical protein WA584_11955 [Pyrinomonadaceae bacterium]